MNTTSVNPGSMQPMKIKNAKQIISSFYGNIKKRDFSGAFRALITNSINLINKNKLISKKGKYFCPICNNNSQSFFHLSNAIRYAWNSACYHCSSRGRHRGLFYLYSEEIKTLDENKKILHFAPEPVFYSIFKNKKFIYHTTDYILTDVDFPKIDVQNIDLPDNQYDLILSNHVIEHVPDDLAALKETYRILKPNGKFILTVPGNYTNNKTVYFKDLSNNGHYRDYGMEFFDTFSSIFKNAKTVDLSSYNEKYNVKIANNEIVFIGEK